MNGPSRRLASGLAALWLAVVLLTVGAAAGASADIHYTKESLQEYAKQLAAGEVASATFNRKVRSIRLTMKDGRHLLVRYERRGFPAAEASLKARHVPVTVLAPSAANKELREKPKHHKIRYIVGGVVIVVIVIVGLVLLVNRRRARD
jgi:hypothetical protein